jgi:hypothetical protein
VYPRGIAVGGGNQEWFPLWDTTVRATHMGLQSTQVVEKTW